VIIHEHGAEGVADSLAAVKSELGGQMCPMTTASTQGGEPPVRQIMS